jgi:pimeloyl-ACP methyl ester carboxylesterase
MTGTRVLCTERTIRIGKDSREGLLVVPEQPHGLVVFAHGSGSSRFSPRNARVARALNERRHATLLFDLLTDREAANRANVFDIPLLGDRVLDALEQVRAIPSVATLPIGLFGASTGAAAALVAAAYRPQDVAAVVSRGGRPDLAASVLDQVHAATLLIVGGADRDVLGLNERALARLKCERALRTIPGATHLFEEPGALDQVIAAAADWFDLWLATPSA